MRNLEDLRVEDLSADQVKVYFPHLLSSMPDLAFLWLEKLLNRPKDWPYFFQEHDLLSEMLSLKIIETSEVRSSQNSHVLHCLGEPIAYARFKPNGQFLYQRKDIVRLYPFVSPDFFLQRAFPLLGEKMEGELGLDGKFKSKELEAKLSEEGPRGRKMLAHLGLGDFSRRVLVQFSLSDQGVSYRVMPIALDEIGAQAKKLSKNLLALALILFSGACRAGEEIDKSMEACLNPDVKIEACQNIQVVKKNVEKIGNDIAKKYGQNPVAMAAAIAAMRRIEINKPLPLSIDNKLLIEPQKVMITVGVQF